MRMVVVNARLAPGIPPRPARRDRRRGPRHRRAGGRALGLRVSLVAPVADAETHADGLRLRAELAAVLEAQRAALVAGTPGAGAAAAAALSDVYDRDLAARWARATADVAGPLALCATGG